MPTEDFDEVEDIKARYRRRTGAAGLYSHLRPEVVASTQERMRAVTTLLRARGTGDLSRLRILDIGCGTGRNLLEMLLFGAAPENLVGNDLQADRLARARHVLPPAVQLLPGDATELRLDAESFDIVHQSVVFSSILDDTLQQRLAECMWRWVRPGGGVLWYDFVYNNPVNPDVRGVPLRRVKELFPGGVTRHRWVTLAPPISRRVVRIHESLYAVFNVLPFLRTHVVCFIGKP
jgi:SAM-dependent methyltransferase